MPSSGRCVCSWGKECQAFHEAIVCLAPEGHPWNDDLIRLELDTKNPVAMSPKKSALYASILHYFPADSDRVVNGQKNLFIWPHHFPVALLEWRVDNKVSGGFLQLLTKNDLKDIEFRDSGRHRMGEDTNSVRYLCRYELSQKNFTEKMLMCFVQSPMETRDAIRSCILDLRRRERQIRLATSLHTDYPTGKQSVLVSAERLNQFEVAESSVGLVQIIKRSCSSVRDKNWDALATAAPAGQIASTNHKEYPSKTPVALVSSTKKSELKKDIMAWSSPKACQHVESPLKKQRIVSVSVSKKAVQSLSRQLDQNSSGRWCSPCEVQAPSSMMPRQHSLAKVARDLFGVSKRGPRPVLLESPSNIAVIAPLPALPIIGCRQELRQAFASMIERPGVTIHCYSDDHGGNRNECNFCSSGRVATLANVLVDVHKNFECFQLGEKGIWFYPCTGLKVYSNHDKCRRFCTRKRHHKDSDGTVLCDKCIVIRQRELRKKREQEGMVEHEKAKKAKRNKKLLQTMSPGTLVSLCQDRQREIKSLRQKVQRLSLRLREHKEDLIVQPGSSVHKVLQQAVSYIQKNMGTSREDIRRAFLTTELQVDITKDIDESVTKQYVDTLLESISNMGEKLRGNDSQCRYSSHVVNTAMCLFLRSRTAYDELRASDILCFPSPRHLRKIASQSRATGGGDPRLYLAFQDQLNLRCSEVGEAKALNIYGHLMMDEIKLKNGVAYNVNSNEVTGFVMDQTFTIRDWFEHAMKEEDSEDTNQDDEEFRKKQTTIYVNQWRYRSTKGITHNGDFFMNTGSLSGDEILRQFQRVVCSYEFIGCRVVGIVSDAGGGNSSFLKLLRNNVKVEGPWPSPECVSCVNPIDATRKICQYTCSTHGLKALRNALYKSQANKVRDFIRDGTHFGWKPIEDCYVRGVKRRAAGYKEARTDLVRHAVYLDSYSVMNCRYAKQPFLDRTICEMIRFVAESLSIKFPVEDLLGTEYTSQWDRFNSVIKALQAACTDATKKSAFLGTIETIRYQVALNTLFIERFSNSRWRVTRDNLASEKAIVKSVLAYFDNWHRQQAELMQTNNNNKSQTARHYLAEQTFHNLLLTSAGFFEYIEAIFRLDPTTLYVTGPHSNQSSLESEFSRVRNFHKDRPDLYGGGISQLNSLRTLKTRNAKQKKRTGDSMYPQEDVGDEVCPGESTGFNAGTKKAEEMSRAKFACLQKDNVGEVDGMESSLLPGNFCHKGTSFGRLLCPSFTKLNLMKDYCFRRFLLEDETFRGFFAMSIRTKHQAWFNRVLDIDHRHSLNSACQKLIGTVFHLVEDYVANRKNTSFEHTVFVFLAGGGLQATVTEFDMLFARDEDIVCLSVLFDLLKEHFFQTWLPSAVKDYRLVTGKATSQACEGQIQPILPLNDDEVNRFVGWSLVKVIRKYKKLVSHEASKEFGDKSSASPNANKEFNTALVAVLEDVQVSEKEVLGDKLYLQRYYPLDDALRNRGGLSLISSPYIESFVSIMRYVRTSITLNTLKDFPTTSEHTIFKKMVEENKTHWLNTLVDVSVARVQTKPSVTRDQRMALFKEMVARLCHARIGSVVKQFRSDALTGSKNAAAFRPSLGVLSKRE